MNRNSMSSRQRHDHRRGYRNAKPERPQTIQKAAAVPPGPDRLFHLAMRLMENKLSVAQKVDLRAWIGMELQGRITVSTVCSGTDAPMLSWRAFARACAHSLHIDLSVDHGFSCEKDAPIRKIRDDKANSNKEILMNR